MLFLTMNTNNLPPSISRNAAAAAAAAASVDDESIPSVWTARMLPSDNVPHLHGATSHRRRIDDGDDDAVDPHMLRTTTTSLSPFSAIQLSQQQQNVATFEQVLPKQLHHNHSGVGGSRIDGSDILFQYDESCNSKIEDINHIIHPRKTTTTTTASSSIATSSMKQDNATTNTTTRSCPQQQHHHHHHQVLKPSPPHHHVMVNPPSRHNHYLPSKHQPHYHHHHHHQQQQQQQQQATYEDLRQLLEPKPLGPRESLEIIHPASTAGLLRHQRPSSMLSPLLLSKPTATNTKNPDNNNASGDPTMDILFQDFSRLSSLPYANLMIQCLRPLLLLHSNDSDTSSNKQDDGDNRTATSSSSTWSEVHDARMVGPPTTALRSLSHGDDASNKNREDGGYYSSSTSSSGRSVSSSSFPHNNTSTATKKQQEKKIHEACPLLLATPEERTKKTTKAAAKKKHTTNVEKWEERYQELLQFRQDNGHCVVPLCYPPNPTLSHWVKRQRYQYKLKSDGKHSTLSRHRQALLERIGFVWDSHHSNWDEKYQELVEYKKMYGHCNVPSSYQATNRALVSWVKSQRRYIRIYFRNNKQKKSLKKKTKTTTKGDDDDDDNNDANDGGGSISNSTTSGGSSGEVITTTTTSSSKPKTKTTLLPSHKMRYSLCPSRVKKLVDLGLRWGKGGGGGGGGGCM